MPGAGTPPHRHDCDERVLRLAGRGEVHGDGPAQRFGPDRKVVLPLGPLHRFVNAGPMPLQILGIFAGTPVGTFERGGTAIALPWQS